MEANTIVVFTADHGELGGHHQMRTKGTNAYRQQIHVPLMICHPAYPGGKECAAITSQLDLRTVIGFTGKDAASRAKTAAGLRGRDFSGLLKSPETAKPETLRPASLFNYNMLSYQDAV
jgi:arylsulfatase A-like enzyme